MEKLTDIVAKTSSLNHSFYDSMLKEIEKKEILDEVTYSNLGR